MFICIFSKQIQPKNCTAVWQVCRNYYLITFLFCFRRLKEFSSWSEEIQNVWDVYYLANAKKGLFLGILREKKILYQRKVNFTNIFVYNKNGYKPRHPRHVTTANSFKKQPAGVTLCFCLYNKGVVLYQTSGFWRTTSFYSAVKWSTVYLLLELY